MQRHAPSSLSPLPQAPPPSFRQGENHQTWSVKLGFSAGGCCGEDFLCKGMLEGESGRGGGSWLKAIQSSERMGLKFGVLTPR